MYRLNRKTGQSLVEYSLILAAIIVAIFFIMGRVRQGVEDRLESAASDIGERYSATGTFNYTINRSSIINETRDTDGKVTTVYEKDETRRDGWIKLPAANEEYWKMDTILGNR